MNTRRRSAPATTRKGAQDEVAKLIRTPYERKKSDGI